jgi:hypothetical protein
MQRRQADSTGIRLGEALRLSDEELATVYYLALLRWIGCTSDASLAASAFGDELVASTWLAPVDKGNAGAMFATMIRHVGG